MEEADEIDLSFLDADEDIATLRKLSSRAAKGKAVASDTRSLGPGPQISRRSAARPKSTVDPRSVRARGDHAPKGSAQRWSSSSSRHTSGAAPKRGSRSSSFIEYDDEDQDEDDEDSDDSIDVDDIIASMNGAGSHKTVKGKGKAPRKSTKPASLPKTRWGASRSRSSADGPSIKTQRRAPPRQRQPLPTSDIDGSTEDQDDETSSRGNEELQQEIKDLYDDSDESDEQPRQTRSSTRRVLNNGDPKLSHGNGRAGPSKPLRTRATRVWRTLLFGHDDNEEEEDSPTESFNARSRNAQRPRQRRQIPSHRITESKEEGDEDDDDAVEGQNEDEEEEEEDEDGVKEEEDEEEEDEEEDELATSDGPSGGYGSRAKRKMSSAYKPAPRAKRQRLDRATSRGAKRGRATPHKAAVKRTTALARPQKMRFAQQGELPKPVLGQPSHATMPHVTMDETLLSGDLASIPFLDGIEASYSPSEQSSEEETVDVDAGSEEKAHHVPDADSVSSSEDAEAYQEPIAPVERHWSRCKRCKDGPALLLYNKALVQLKRAQKREVNKRRNKSAEHLDSLGRQRKTLMDDSWGAVTPAQQAAEWIEVLEDRGGWFECGTCSVSWHWGCLPQDTQKAILLKINTEQTRRHRSVFGEQAPAPAPIRSIDVDEIIDTASCPDCTGYASYCTLCKANVYGVRTVEEQLGFTEAVLEQYPGPPAELKAAKLFRCERCSRATHYECLARAQTDGGQSLEEVARSFQDAGWLCPDCHRWPAVDRIIAWRQLDRSLWNDEEAKRCTYARLSPRENLPREYLVKFRGKSFRETEWVPHDWLRILHQGTLFHFLAKGSRIELEPAELVEPATALASARRSRASIALGGGRAPASVPVKTQSVKKMLQIDETGEVDVGPPGPEPDAQVRIPRPWKMPDRILAVKFYFSITQENDDEHDVGGAIVDSDTIPLEKLQPSDYLRSWVHVAKLLVKWQDQPYEGSTWEDPPTRRKQPDIFYECQEAYRAFLTAQKVTFPALSPGEKQQKRERRLAKSGARFRALDDQPHYIEGGDLLDFQLEGVNWLRYGWYNEKPGILADEMGLGKTVQIITFLASIWKEGKAGPFLVVVPNATLPNWMREFEKWMPQFRVVPYWGEYEARDMISKYEFFHSKKTLAEMDGAIRPVKFHVVVASDSSVRSDSLPLRKAGDWDVVIVDEGQNLKSGKSLLLKRLNDLHAEHRIIMTGTPLNNNVTELFNLLNWLEPGGQWKDVKALENEYSVLKPEVIEELQKRLKPYFLRRLKKEVLDLPPKIELIVPMSLRPIQKRIYRSILESNIEDIQALAASRDTGYKKNKKTTFTNLNNTLMQLRKCVQHPYLIAPDLETREGEDNYEATWEHQRLIDASAKLSLLQRLLPKLKADGHRILLFSQFVINLNIVEVFLRGEGYKFLRLDGDVGQKQRQKGIDAFNAPDSPYFIYMISTRAGGVGINLATADTVIIMDPDWNPHVDMQAIARAHRIGQTKKLLVFTLMCKGTAEEKMLEGAKRKMMLDHLIVQSLDNENERPEELESILKFGAQALFAEGGTEESERDIRYTDEDLISLLRRREDAGEEENDRSDATGEAHGTFSYARVWEADQATATDAGAVAPATVIDDDFWADLLVKHREEAAKRAAEARERDAQEKRASRRERIKAMLQEEEDANPPSPVPAKRGRGRTKKASVIDEDWTATAADAEHDSDDYELVGVVREEDELLPAVQALRRRQNKSSRAMVAAAGAAASKIPAVSASTSTSVSAKAADPNDVDVTGYSVSAVVRKPAAVGTAAQTTAAVTSATAQRSTSSQPNLASLQRELIAEHRLPRPAPLADLDLSLPAAVVRPGHLAAMRRVLLSLLYDSDFSLEVASRSQSSVIPDLSPPHMRFQLTNTHINYYMQTFSVPRELFEAAFSIIAEESIPPEILALPHGGAIALDWRKIREILIRTATYMVLALRRPKNEPPWKSAIEEWNKAQAGRPALTALESGYPDAPDPQTTGAALDVLRDRTRAEAWLNAISARGDAELTKVAQLAVSNPAATSSPDLLLTVQNFVHGKSVKPAYEVAKLTIQAGMPSTVQFHDPDIMAAPLSTGAASASPATASASTSSAPQSRPNRVAAALSRLSAFSGGSPTRLDVSKKELNKLKQGVAVTHRKTPIKSSRSSISGSPRSSMGPSPSPALSNLAGDSYPSEAAGDGGETRTLSAQTCIICGGTFHYLNRCPEMQDVTRASARWFQLCDQLRVLIARGLTDGDSDVATIKTTIKVMARKLNGLRAQAGQGPLVAPFV